MSTVKKNFVLTAAYSMLAVPIAVFAFLVFSTIRQEAGHQCVQLRALAEDPVVRVWVKDALGNDELVDSVDKFGNVKTRKAEEIAKELRLDRYGLILSLISMKFNRASGSSGPPYLSTNEHFSFTIAYGRSSLLFERDPAPRPGKLDISKESTNDPVVLDDGIYLACNR